MTLLFAGATVGFFVAPLATGAFFATGGAPVSLAGLEDFWAIAFNFGAALGAGAIGFFVAVVDGLLFAGI